MIQKGRETPIPYVLFGLLFVLAIINHFLEIGLLSLFLVGLWWVVAIIIWIENQRKPLALVFGLAAAFFTVTLVVSYLKCSL